MDSDCASLRAELLLSSELSIVGVLTECVQRAAQSVHPTQTTETAQPPWPREAWQALTRPKTAKRQEQRDLGK